MYTQLPMNSMAQSVTNSSSNHIQQPPPSSTTMNDSHNSNISPTAPFDFEYLRQLQKTIGNQAASYLIENNIQPQLPSQQPTAPIRSPQVNHQKYLYERVSNLAIDTSTDSLFLLAEACAFMLDHNHYDLAQMTLPAKFSGIAPMLPSSGDAQDYLNIVHGYIQNLGQQTSAMQWDPLTASGTGTGAHVQFAPNGHAEGSPTSKPTPWMQILNKRKDKSKTLYVMGHLINADLGGPGLDYNYVPLPGRAGWYGANDANGIHSKGIEQIVKSKYALLGKDVSQLEYHVNAVYPREARSNQMNELSSAPGHMNSIEQTLGLDANMLLSKLPVNSKQTLKAQIQDISNLEPMLYAVSSNNYWQKSWNNLKLLLQENLELWQQEDELVPKQLDTLLKWEQRGVKEELQLTVPIQLPDRIDTPYNSNRSLKYKTTTPVNHDNQYNAFLTKNSSIQTDNSSDATDANVAAFLMDMNEYDREQIKDLVDNLLTLHELKKKLTQANLSVEQQNQIQNDIQSLSLAYDLLQEDPTLAKVLSNVEVVPLLAEQLKLPSSELITKVINYVQTDHIKKGSQRVFSKFEYSGSTPWGSPSKVVAHLQKNGHPEGTSAGGDSEWMLKLEERRDETKTLYVRGHMLNRHLGGAGLDSNMVPLTGREGWYGANNANGLHSNIVEEHVKYLYSELAEDNQQNDPSKVTNLVYTVEAVFGNHNRPNTSTITHMARYYKENIIDTIMNELLSTNLQLDDRGLMDKYTNLTTQQFVLAIEENLAAAQEHFLLKLFSLHQEKYENELGKDIHPLEEPLRSRIIKEYSLNNLSTSQMIEAWNRYISVNEYKQLGKDAAVAQLTQAEFSRNFSAPIASLPVEHSTRIEQLVSNFQYLSDVLHTLSPAGNYKALDVYTILDHLRANSELWVYEDAYVPTHLVVRATWTQHGQNRDTGDTNVPIVLPSDITAPYRPRGEK